MKVINPILRKVLVELQDLEYPLEFWWDDEMINDFEKILKRTKSETIRAHNTPNSIIEFNLKHFRGFNVTSKTEIILSGQGWHLTNIFRYYESFALLPPDLTLNPQFDFPNTLTCHLNKRTRATMLLDISNRITLDILISRGIAIEEFFKTALSFNNSESSQVQILFAEYAFST